MRKLHRSATDNLDLLLDTMCNLLGALVLIACLLVVLIQPQAVPEDIRPGIAAAKEAGILAEKRLAAARAELDGLQKLRGELQSAAGPTLLPLITERETLKKTADKMRQERARQDEIATEKARNAVRDAGDEISRLREQKQELERRLGRANTDTEAARQRKAALEKQLADLALELDNVADVKIEKLRFPRERRITKTPESIIVQFGEVFPLTDGKGNFLESIRRVPGADGNFTTFPKKSEGLNPVSQAAALRDRLTRIASKGSYVTVYVYPDSYAAFRELKRLIHDLKVDYGLEICVEHRILRFGLKGSAPAPL